MMNEAQEKSYKDFKENFEMGWIYPIGWSKDKIFDPWDCIDGNLMISESDYKLIDESDIIIKGENDVD